jgi:hypothetical protein
MSVAVVRRVCTTLCRGSECVVSDACVCECDGLMFCVVRLAVSLACFLACENSRGPVTTYIHIYAYRGGAVESLLYSCLTHF